MGKLLAIDDDESMRAIIAHKLHPNYEVITVQRGNDALAVMEKEKIDLVLMDQMMPNMTGLETFKLLKERFVDLPPVIMMTAFSNLELATAFLKAGGSDFILKPLDFEILEVKIRNAIRLREVGDGTRRPVSEADVFFAVSCDGFCSMELDGTIRLANRAFEEMLFYPKGDLRGRNFLDKIVHASDLEFTNGELEHLKSKGLPIRVENRLLCSDGTVKTVSWAATLFGKKNLIFITAREVVEGFQTDLRLAI